jgi:hypothetical protein
MTFDAGSIEARLILNRQAFQDDLAAARAEGDAFDGNTFEAIADVNTDAVTEAFAKIQSEWNALKTSLANSSDLSVSDGEALAAIGATEAAYQTLRESMGQTIEINTSTNIINPDSTDFNLAPVTESVTLDPAEALAALAEITAAYDALIDDLARDNVLDVDTLPFQHAVMNAEYAIETLRLQVARGDPLLIDSTEALTAIHAVADQYTELRAIAGPPVDPTINPAEAMAALAEIQSRYDSFIASLTDEQKLNIDTMSFNATLLQARIAVNDLDVALKNPMSLNVSDAEAIAAITDTGAAYLALKAVMSSGISLGGGSATGAEAGALRAVATNLASVGDAADDTTKKMSYFNSAESLGMRTGGAFSTAINILRGSVTLFGGALDFTGVHMLSAVGGFHLLFEAIVETAGTLIPAAIAFTAFGVAAIPVAEQIYKQMTNVYTVSTALGTTIYPLSNGFSKIAAAVKPEVYEAFGEALVFVGRSTGAFQSLATAAGSVVDQLGARFVAATTDGGGFNSFVTKAASDLSGWGNNLGDIFGIFGNFLKVLPGYAEEILSAFGAVANALEHITGSGVGQWILDFGLKLHGAIVYGGLMVTAVVILGNALVGLAAKFGLAEAGALAFNSEQFGVGIKLMGSYIADLVVSLFTMSGAEDVAAASTGILEAEMVALDAVNPLVWVGLAAAALAGLVYWLTRSTSATQDYDNAVKNTLSNAPITQLSVDIVQSMAVTTADLGAAQIKLAQTQEYVTTTNLRTGTTTTSLTKAYQDQQAVVQGYQGELSTLSGYQTNYNILVKAAGGNLGDLSAAGITANDIMQKGVNANGSYTEGLKEMIVEVQAQADAFNAMQLGVGRNAAAMNAMNFSAGAADNSLGNLDTTMAKITQSQDALSGVLLGGEQNFYTYASDLEKIQTASQVAGASLSGLGTSSIALGGDFYNTLLPAAQKTVDALEMQLIPTNKLIPAVGALGTQMNTYAGTNVAARTAVVDFINNALGPGTVSLKTLNTWLGKNATSMGGLKSIVDQTEISASKLGGLLQGDLNQIMANSVLIAEHASTAFQAFSASVLGGTTSGVGFAAQGQKVLTILEKQYGQDVPAAKTAFIDYAKNGLGLSTSAAQTLWDTLDKQQLDTMSTKANTSKAAFIDLAKNGLDLSNTSANNLWTTMRAQYLDTLANKVGTNKADWIDLARNGLDLTTTEASKLWAEMRNQYLDTLAQKAGETEAAFVKTANQLGVTTTNAGLLWDALHKVAAGSPYNASLNTNATGSGGVVITGTGTASGQGNIKFTSGAAGAYVTQGTTPTADDVLAWVSKGELIVPTHLEPEVRPILSGRIPGYAPGGFVGNLDNIIPYTQNETDTLAAKALMTDAEKALAADKAKASAAEAKSTGTTKGDMSAAAIAALWISLGGASGAADNMAEIADAESGDDPSIVQQGEPPGLTGYGLYQITPTSGITQNGAFGNLLNASNNTRAAISLYNASGYSPWTSDPVGSRLAGAKGMLVPGYASGGIVGEAKAYLKAYDTGKDKTFINTRIDDWTDALKKNTTLAGAPLSAKEHASFLKLAASDKKNLAAMVRERATLRTYRTDLGDSNSKLQSWISAAANEPTLKGDVKSWKALMKSQTATSNKISKMLGLTPDEQAAATATALANATAASAAAASGSDDTGDSSTDPSSTDTTTTTATVAAPTPVWANMPLGADANSASLALPPILGGSGSSGVSSVSPVLSLGTGGTGAQISDPKLYALQISSLGSKLDQICSLLNTLNSTTAAVPKGVGSHVGGTLSTAASNASFRNRYPRGGT